MTAGRGDVGDRGDGNYPIWVGVCGEQNVARTAEIMGMLEDGDFGDL